MRHSDLFNRHSYFGLFVFLCFSLTLLSFKSPTIRAIMSSESAAKVEDTEGTREDPGVQEASESEELNLQRMEQIEEAKLKAKYPAAKKPGGTTFLQKRLNRGQKYFDSGDYNMAKANGQKRSIPVVPQPTGEAIPTPDNLPTRKTSLVQSKLAAGLT